MPSKSSSDLDRGRRVGKYEIITRLSVGGMAELFLAYLPGPGGFKKFVALKQILPDVKADDSFVKMFLDEARITAAFNNANIGQVFDLGEEGQELYLAMEFIAGQNLEQVTKRAAKRELAIPVGFAARVVRDSALGLHYAHHFTDPTGQPMAVVHRDVSPKNVMITWTGQVKVIDFGIAKARGRLNRTMVGVVKGTSGYMSPEQVKNEPLDGRTDLFAASVMLHELLAGERLFTAPTDAGMMLKIVEGEVTPPSTNNPYVTPELSDVVMKCLSKKREQRFNTGREFARAIEQACPDLFEDEQLAEFMGQLFEDKIAITRSLLEAANDSDQASMKQAAAGLTTDEREVEAKPAKKTGGVRANVSLTSGPPTATPNPRPGLKSTSGSSNKLPRVGPTKESKVAGSSRQLPPVSAKSSMKLPRVPAPPPLPEEETVPPNSRSPFAKPKEDLDATLPPRSKSQMKLPQVVMPPKPVAPPPPEAEQTDAPAKKKGGSLGTIFALLVLVGILGGLVWAVTVGPFKDQFTALTEEPKAPDTTPKKVDLEPTPDGEKPAWLVEKEKQKAEQEAERKRMAQIEAAANDPERQRMLAELEAELKQLDYLEAEQRSLKLAAQAGAVAGVANGKKIEDLQKQIDDLKTMMAEKQNKKTAPKKVDPANPEVQVEIVKDLKGAKNADIGYLSLRTVNPSSANVIMNGDELGSTPLSRVPVEAGVHKLRLIDGDGKPRMLSITIEAGKTNEMRAVDVSSLPLIP
ncbi:MAG: protein kinase [Archangium sp.]|nr:protein kinase [Archangium sp.]MDP3573758.1 protein kinase [Archangium sp.]